MVFFKLVFSLSTYWIGKSGCKCFLFKNIWVAKLRLELGTAISVLKVDLGLEFSISIDAGICGIIPAEKLLEMADELPVIS